MVPNARALSTFVSSPEPRSNRERLERKSKLPGNESLHSNRNRSLVPQRAGPRMRFPNVYIGSTATGRAQGAMRGRNKEKRN